MDTDLDFAHARADMVRTQLQDRGIRSPAVLDAMRSVPRHLFVPEQFRHLAYADGPLAIGEDQTISQPFIVALMTELLELGQEARVLEIGTGSGYQSAVLSRLARQVYSVERHAVLADRARRALKEIGADNVHVFVDDGSIGLPEHAPYDGIVVTAAAPGVPRPLLQQLADRARLVLPVGGRDGQRLQLIQREGDRLRGRKLSAVAFVPLRGEEGWSEEAW